MTRRSTWGQSDPTITTRCAPAANSRANAWIRRAPRPAPRCGRNAMGPNPANHSRTRRARPAGVNQTVVRYPEPVAARTTRRPKRWYSVAASAEPMAAANRVLTRPGIGALTKMPSARTLGGTPARQAARRHTDEVERDQRHVHQPGAHDPVRAIAAPRRDERRRQRPDRDATPAQRPNQRHVFHDGKVGGRAHGPEH